MAPCGVQDLSRGEWTLVFRNTSEHDTPILENIRALDGVIAGSRASKAFDLHYSRGSRNQESDFEPLETKLPAGESAEFAPNGGRSSDGYLPFFDVRNPAGANVMLGIGWTGTWSLTLRHEAGRGLVASAGQQRTRFHLHAGESVRTPSVLLMFWQGCDEFRGHNLWRSLMLAAYTPHPDGKLPQPPLAFSPHAAIPFTQTNEENMLEALAVQARDQLAFDTYWIDAGWYTIPKDGDWDDGTGNIVPDPTRFPRGFRPIGDAAHKLGMKFLLWFEPERVARGTWIATNHPEWLVKPEENIPVGNAHLRRHGYHLLDLGNPAAVEFLKRWVGDLIASSGIDIYRQDFNIEPRWYWEFDEPADRIGMREAHHVEGLYSFWDALLERFPSLLIDNCASGGRRIDLETLRRSVPLWRSDKDWKYYEATQAMTYGLSQWVPLQGLGAISAKPYEFRSGMSSTFNCPPAFRDAAFMKRLAPMLRSYRDVQALYQGDYYPLTPYSRTNDTWIAWQFDRPDTGEGIVQAFRRSGSAAVAATYKLHGLSPKATYCVTNWDSQGSTCLTGDQLSHEGLAIRLPEKRSAAVLVYRRSGACPQPGTPL